MEVYKKDLQDDAGYNDKNPVEELKTIPVIHERVSIDKTLVETGKVKITKRVNEENQVLEIPLVHEEIDIKTIPVNQFVDSIPEAVRYEGDTMIIPVLKEVSVIRIMIEKEIHITKKKIQTVDSQTVTLRKEEVIVDDSNLANSQHHPQNL